MRIMAAKIRARMVLLAALLASGACATLPAGTLTGKVYDIRITDEEVLPLDVVVEVGDEVRFHNERISPTYVSFFRDSRDELACKRGFTFSWGLQEAAKIESSESASLCFTRPGEVGYSVQFEVTNFGGIGGSPGEISVPPGRSGAIIVKGSGKP
jgi:plastocyanin